jgi:ferredoxin
MFGAVPGLTKAKFHSLYMRKAAFADMILDVLSVATPDLVIMDGILGMEGDGPGRSGTPVSLGTLLASTDSLAVDLAVCRMLALEPVGIPVLRQARLRGLLPSALHFPLLTPEDVMHGGYQLPLAATYLLTGENPPSRYPAATDGCTGCKACEEICPKGAIVISKGTACVDKEKCIRCYCCQEACPEGAIVLQEIR